MTESPIKIVLVDDHVGFRRGLASMLKTEHDMLVIGQGGSAAEAIDLAKELQPQLIILDLDMPGGGLAAAAHIAGLLPATKIIILTVFVEERLITTLQQSGVHGYVIKGTPARRLTKAIRSVYQGTPYWPAFREGVLIA